jgi:hypothetical protein
MSLTRAKFKDRSLKCCYLNTVNDFIYVSETLNQKSSTGSQLLY